MGRPGASIRCGARALYWLRGLGSGIYTDVAMVAEHDVRSIAGLARGPLKAIFLCRCYCRSRSHDKETRARTRTGTHGARTRNTRGLLVVVVVVVMLPWVPLYHIVQGHAGHLVTRIHATGGRSLDAYAPPPPRYPQ